MSLAKVGPETVGAVNRAKFETPRFSVHGYTADTETATTNRQINRIRAMFGVPDHVAAGIADLAYGGAYHE